MIRGQLAQLRHKPKANKVLDKQQHKQNPDKRFHVLPPASFPIRLWVYFPNSS
jgi:hypothetical protein